MEIYSSHRISLLGKCADSRVSWYRILCHLKCSNLFSFSNQKGLAFHINFNTSFEFCWCSWNRQECNLKWIELGLFNHQLNMNFNLEWSWNSSDYSVFFRLIIFLSTITGLNCYIVTNCFDGIQMRCQWCELKVPILTLIIRQLKHIEGRFTLNINIIIINVVNNFYY